MSTVGRGVGAVLVLGASRGIGLELVRQYRASGARVVATARDAEALVRLKDLGAQGLALDVNDTAQCAGLAWQLDGEAFAIAWLVAGVYGPRSHAPQTPVVDEFDMVMHTNVLAAMRLLPLVADALAPGARLGVLSSIMGSMGRRGDGSGWLYRASKAALNSVVKDMSFVLEGRATVASFHPGWVRTNMGGPDATLAVDRSASDLRASLLRLTPADNGGFFNHDGAALPW